MKDSKTRTKNSAQIKVVSKDIRERLELIDEGMNLNLQSSTISFPEPKTVRKNFTSSTSSLC